MDKLRQTPIFTALTLEFQRQGKSLPWLISIRPTGTIGILSETTRGLEPKFARFYSRKGRVW